MADAVTSNVIINTPDQYVIHLTNICDGTGESAVVKVDKSALTAPDGAEPASLDIDAVRWNVQGFTSVRILWDHTSDDTALVLGTGSGYDDFRSEGYITGRVATAGLADPRSSGETGDILLTTAGNSSGNTYDITLWIRKRSD